MYKIIIKIQAENKGYRFVQKDKQPFRCNFKMESPNFKGTNGLYSYVCKEMLSESEIKKPSRGEGLKCET